VRSNSIFAAVEAVAQCCVNGARIESCIYGLFYVRTMLFHRAGVAASCCAALASDLRTIPGQFALTARLDITHNAAKGQ